MSWAQLFHRLWQAEWSSTNIAEFYGVGEERVRVLVGAEIVRGCDEAGIAI
jgi:hypothetical protein